MGCFGKSSKEGDFEWEDFENPIGQSSEDRKSFDSEGDVPPSRRLARGSTLASSVDSANRAKLIDRRDDDREKIDKKSGEDDARQKAPDLLEPNHSTRLNTQLQYTVSTVAEGITQGIHDTYGREKEAGVNLFVEIIDWTTVHDMHKLKQECVARGLATHGRALAFSKIALQNSLNKFDMKERTVDHKASHMDGMTFDREKNWRDSAASSDKSQTNMMNQLKNKTTGAH